MNTIILTGRLTADPELKRTGYDDAVTHFSLAVERPLCREKTVDFIHVVAWKHTAEFICRFFRKGSMILVQGSLQSQHYEDKNGGKRTAYGVVAERAEFCTNKNDSHPTPGKSAPSRKSVDEGIDYNPVESDDDFPF